MVGSSAHRSASPASSRSNPNPNPNPRNNNIEREGNGFRKSLNGHPFLKSLSNYQQKILVPNNTPVNSPAEYARSSFGRDSGGTSFRDHEQKENERDHNIKPALRAKSPSITAKGTKNFMSPTISAASKINPSPRKKVLGDRNEAIRTSASLSDGKFHFFSANSLDSDDESETKFVIKHPPSSTTPLSFSNAENEPVKHGIGHQNGSDSVHGEVRIVGPEADLVVLSPEVPLENEALDADLVVFNPEVPLTMVKALESLPLGEMPKTASDENKDLDTKRVVYSSPSTKVALEADPSIPPYDPKNNYLSPRPQFLHYNPNWRTESYANQGINLEDDFICESGSEIENSSEEVQSEDSLRDQEDASSSSSSAGISTEEIPRVSETNLTESEQLVEIDEAKLEPERSRGFAKWKMVAALLLLSLGFMSISLIFCPEIGEAMYGDEIVSQVYNNPHMVALVENFNGLVENAKAWSAHSVDYLSQMLQNMRGADHYSTPIFANLTAWQEDEGWGGYMTHKIELTPYFESIKDGSQTVRNEISDASAQIPGYSELQDDETSDEGDDFQSEEVEQIYEIEDELSIETQSYPTSEDNVDASADGAELIKLDDSAQMQSDFSPEDNESSAVEAELIKPDDPEPEDLVKESLMIEDGDAVMSEQELSTDKPENMVDELSVYEPGSDDKLEVESSLSPPQVPEFPAEVITANDRSEKSDVKPAEDARPLEDDIIIPASESDNSLAQVAAAVILVIVSLFASLMYMKSKKDNPSSEQLVAEKKNNKYAASNTEPLLRAHLPNQPSQVEVDMIGASCPSEMSSFQNSTYTKTTQEGSDEAHSLQKSSKRSYKRESLAASSSEYTMNSSYGSFSTYSVIHPKRGDEEVITPVRRSNRIRSKVTSP